MRGLSRATQSASSMPGRDLGAVLAAMVLWTAAAAAQPVADGATPHIRAVISDPAVIAAIEHWGLSLADVQHDIDAMSPSERARLAYLLTRRWPANATHGPAEQQAQFLVTLSLLRESTLFASIVTRSPARLR